MNDLIEQLAASKAFQTLSVSEQKMVLEQMTQADYDQLHLVLKALPTIHATALPSADLKAQLIQRMAIQERVVPRSHRILLWLKAAAVLFMGVAIGYGFRSDRVQWVEKQVFVPTYIPQIDTVLVTKIGWRTRVKWQYDTIKIPDSTIGYADLGAPPLGRLDSMGVDCWVPKPSLGTALGDTPDLMNFFVNPQRFQ